MGDLLIDAGLTRAQLLARVPEVLAAGNALLAELELVDFLADPAIQATIDELLIDFTSGAVAVGAIAVGLKLAVDRTETGIRGAMGDGLSGFFAALGNNFIQSFTSISTLLGAKQKTPTTVAAARLGTALLAGTKADHESHSEGVFAQSSASTAIRVWVQITLAKSQVFLLQGLDVIMSEPSIQFFVFFYAGRPVGPIEGGTVAPGELIASPHQQVIDALPFTAFTRNLEHLANRHPFAIIRIDGSQQQIQQWRVGGNDYIPMKSYHYMVISESASSLDSLIVTVKGHKVELDFGLFFNF